MKYIKFKTLYRKFLHWKWQKRWNKAEKNARNKALSYFDVHTKWYFKKELDKLKKLKE